MLLLLGKRGLLLVANFFSDSDAESAKQEQNDGDGDFRLAPHPRLFLGQSPVGLGSFFSFIGGEVVQFGRYGTGGL
jgi:hypothetical protein